MTAERNAPPAYAELGDQELLERADSSEFACGNPADLPALNLEIAQRGLSRQQTVMTIEVAGGKRYEIRGEGEAFVNGRSIGLLNPFALGMVLESIDAVQRQPPEERLYHCTPCSSYHRPGDHREVPDA